VAQRREFCGIRLNTAGLGQRQYKTLPTQHPRARSSTSKIEDLLSEALRSVRADKFDLLFRDRQRARSKTMVDIRQCRLCRFAMPHHPVIKQGLHTAPFFLLLARDGTTSNGFSAGSQEFARNPSTTKSS
jgi:hypothetical protein